MKRIFTSGILLAALTLVLFSFSACDEDEVLNTTGLQYFFMEFKPIGPPDYDLELLREQLKDPPSTLTSGSMELNNLTPDDDPTLTRAAHDITISGDPKSTSCQTDIYITEKQVAHKNFVKHVRIVLVGKLEVGKVFTNDISNQNYAEMVFADDGINVFSTRVGNDTYYELRITGFNETTRQIEGEFILALRHEDNPDTENPIIGFGGEFKYTYRVPG